MLNFILTPQLIVLQGKSLDLETERQFFRAAATILLARLYMNGGYVPGLKVGSDKMNWLIGEVDNTIEMQMIIEEEKDAN